MSIVNDGGPAFPVEKDYPACRGMMLRDYFAGKALSLLILGGNLDEHPDGGREVRPVELARDSYLIADAMIAARSEGGAK